MQNINKIISDTEILKKEILKSSKTISNQKIKDSVDKWLQHYYMMVLSLFKNNEKSKFALNYLKTSSTNGRLIRKKWLLNLNCIIKNLKENKYNKSNLSKYNKSNFECVLEQELLEKIKKDDNKIYILGTELNYNWQSKNCWNSCGILMRIILERTLDKKNIKVKQKIGLKNKINLCLSSNIFGKSIKESLKKLDNSTKITGDIVAHDSNILLCQNDIELSIIPFNVLLKDVFN